MDHVATTTSMAIGFAGFELRPWERSVSHSGSPVKLGARAFDVLMALVERRDRIVTKDELFDIVWPGLVVEESNLQVQVSTLRKLFGQGVIATIPGRGYRFVAQLDERLRGTEAKAALVPNNLPQQRTQFIGRGKELAHCTALLRDAGLLTMTGVGGCGKTRLALQLAQMQLSTFPDGVWFVDLAPLQEAEGVVVALAGIIHVNERVGVSPIDLIVEQLSQRRVLLLFDNCEHVIDAVASACETLLAHCRHVKIVATSREGLGLKGEQLYSVRQLSLPESNAMLAMDVSEAVRLFLDRARLTVPELVLDESNAPAIAEICRRLDGIALAIELAAARAAVLTFEAIRDRLDDRFRLLMGGRRALPRHQTLLATMQWSYELLSPSEQHLFRQLAVVAGGCTLAAAARIAGVADEYEVLQLLTRLHDKSMLHVDRNGDSEPRYRMLETVRQYAYDRLQDSGEGSGARDRHLDYFVELAEKAEIGLRGAEQGLWLARLRLEQENLLAALAWAEHANGAEPALRLVAALSSFWVGSDQIVCGLRVSHNAVRSAQGEVGARTQARALVTLCQLRYIAGQYKDAVCSGEEALELAHQASDAQTTLRAMRWLANARNATGELEGPQNILEQCRDLARNCGDTNELSSALNALGELRRSIGDLPQAAQYYEESIALTRVECSPSGICAVLGNLARARILLGQLDRARGNLLEGLQTAIDAGLKSICTCGLDPAAALAHSLGDAERAARYYGAAECARELATHVREPVDEAFIRPVMAQVRDELGKTRYEIAERSGRNVGFDETLADAVRWLQSAVH